MGFLCLNLDQITDSHIVNDFYSKTFLEQFCKLQQNHAIMVELWVKLYNRKLVQRGTLLPNTFDYFSHIKITPIHNFMCIGSVAVMLWNSYL